MSNIIRDVKSNATSNCYFNDDDKSLKMKDLEIGSSNNNS